MFLVVASFGLPDRGVISMLYESFQIHWTTDKYTISSTIVMIDCVYPRKPVALEVAEVG